MLLVFQYRLKMEPLRIKINTPIIYRNNGEETLFNIPKEKLCLNTNNPTAYWRADGVDARSLKVTNSGVPCDFLSINYDADKKIAKVNINWANFKLNQSSQTLIIQIKGNHNVNIEVVIKILYPVKEPSIKLETKTGSTVWGREDVGNIIIKGSEDVGHDIWRYMYKTKVFIARVEGFYVEGISTTQYAGVSGYMLSLNPWERKVIPIKYAYGDTFITQEIEKKLPLIYIYYTKNNSGQDVIRKQMQDVFVMKFSPLMPSISIHSTKLQSEYVLGTREANLFEIKLLKSDIHALELCNVSLTCSDTRLVISDEGNSKYLVSLKTSSFQELPSENLSVRLKASASNASDEDFCIVFTTSQLNIKNSILLKKQNLIEIKDTSEVQQNSKFVLYEGMDCRDVKLVITNVSSRVLGGNNIRELKNIKVELVSDFGVKFTNGTSIKKIQRLQDSSFESIDIRIQPADSSSIKEFRIIVSSDFCNNLVIPVKIETKKKLEPQICIEFEQEVPLKYVDNGKQKPIHYDNQRIGILKIESICNDDPAKYAPYSLLDNPIKLADPRLNIKPLQFEELLLPQKIISFEVFFSGILKSDDYFIVNSGEIDEEVPLLLQEQLYCLPEQIDFIPINNDMQFEYVDVDKLLIGKLDVQFSDEENLADVDICIYIHEPFCFEGGINVINIKKGDKYIDVFIKFDEIFGKVQNIQRTYQTPLNISLTSTILKESEDGYYGDIKIIPIVAEAKPFATIVFDNQPLDNQPALVYYTKEWYDDDRNDVCNLLLGNMSSLPYFPNSDDTIDYVEFTDIRVLVLNGPQVLALDSADTVLIKNGETSQSFAIYLNCDSWDKATKEFAIEVRANIRTINQQENNVVICTDCFILKETRNDGIFSLDLGTTGIVMAKQEDYEISTVHLQDDGDTLSQHIEDSEDIISSITIVYDEAFQNSEENAHQILLSPRRTDYKNKAKFIFVPSKFMVGQERIPYIKRYINDISYVGFDPLYTSSEENVNYENDCIYALDANQDGIYLTPDIFLQLIYENILNRCEQRGNIKKLILTYPNTYTQNVLEKLRVLVSEKIEGLSGFVEMVPESDAVVAYYFNERINYFGDDAKEAEIRKINVGTERVIIYDMGAGTLDLSLVSITRKENEKSVSANIEKKIGIPIAGNYLDWVLFSDFFINKIKNKEDKTLKNLKDYIKKLKQSYSSCSLDIKIPAENADDCLEGKYVEALSSENNNDNVIKYKDLDDAIKNYIDLCSSTILDIFLGENKSVDRLVFSGRGSQFGPLRLAVEKYLRGANKNLIIDTTIEVGNLKTCVAKGALWYNDLFGADSDHIITNRNQHLNLGIVYIAPSADGSKNEICYKEIIHPDDNKWNEAEFCDGTWWRVFDNTIIADLSVKNKKVYFIQTLLNSERIKKLYRHVYANPNVQRTDIDWVFVNELYSFNTNSLTQHEREKIPVNVRIDKENNISYKVGGRYPKGEKLVDKIENNIFYQNGMWPYVVFDN